MSKVRAYLPSAILILLSAAFLGCGGGRTTTTSSLPTPPPITPQPAAPTVSVLFPSKATAGGVDLVIGVQGSGFAVGATLLWNGSPRTTRFNSPTYVSATITAADIAKPGLAKVSVQNGSNDPLAASRTLDFTISALRLNVVSPSHAVEGSGAIRLILTGAGFVPGSRVQWNGSDRPASILDSSTIAVDIPDTDLQIEDLADITVVTPGANAEVSNAVLFPVLTATSRSIERVSLASDGSQLTVDSTRPAASVDGRVVAYASGNHTSGYQVMVRDTCLNAAPCSTAVVVASVDTAGLNVRFDNHPDALSLSSDGRFVAFATDPYGAYGSGFIDIGIRDTCLTAPSGCSPSTAFPLRDQAGQPLYSFSAAPSLSGDARYMAFSEGYTDGYGFEESAGYIYDTCRGAPAGCSPSKTPIAPGYAFTSSTSLSQSGRYLAYTGDPNGGNDYLASDFGLWLRDTCTGAPEGCKPQAVRVGNSLTAFAASATGRYLVYFQSFSAGEVIRIFRYDSCFGATAECVPSTSSVSVDSAGRQMSGVGSPSISGDGKRVVFTRSFYDPYRGAWVSHVLMRDFCADPTSCKPRTVLLSTRDDGTPADAPSYSPVITADGRYVVFESAATNLVPHDTNGVSDIFRVSTEPIPAGSSLSGMNRANSALEAKP